MLQLFRYLHTFRWTLLLAIVCICLQVFLELQLPGLMSSLVNTGIQNRGIENAAPEVIPAADARLVETFMTPEEVELLTESYQAQPGGIWERRELPAEQLDALNRAFTVSEWTVLLLMADLPGGAEIGSAARSERIPDLSEVNLAAIRGNADELADLPPAVADAARLRSEAIPERLAAQTGAAFAASFYEAAGWDPEVVQRNYMFGTGALMALCAGLAGGFSLLVSFAAAQTGSGLARNLRRAVYTTVQGFTRADFDHYTKASLLTRTTADITLVQSTVISGIRILVFAVCMGVGGVVLAAASSAALAWILAGAVAAAGCVMLCIFRITRPRYRIVQNMIDRLNLIAREDVAGAATIRVFGGEQHEEERFDQANDLLATTQLGINRVLIFLSPAFGLILNGASLAIVMLGAEAVQHSLIEVGSIIADVQYVGVVLTAFALVAGMFVVVPRADVSAERIRAVLERQHPGETGALEAPAPPLAVEAVSFSYPGSPVPAVKDVSFEAPTGSITAVLGLTGSGKTTLLDLLVRAHDPDAGAVRLNGKDIRTLAREALDGAISYLPQDRDPLPAGTPADDYLEPGWIPGPAQPGYRLTVPALRRLVLSGPAALFVLDDPFAGMLERDLAALWQELRAASERGAVLLAASHVRHVRSADRILMLEGGRITASGTHSELLSASDLYRRLAQAEGEDHG